MFYILYQSPSYSKISIYKGRVLFLTTKMQFPCCKMDVYGDTGAASSIRGNLALRLEAGRGGRRGVNDSLLTINFNLKWQNLKWQ